MLRRIAAVTVAAALASCAGLEPVGRTAGRSPAPTPPAASAPTAEPAAQPAPPPPQATVTPAPAQRVEAPPVAAPQIAAPPPPLQTAARDDDGIVVQGGRDLQVPPPNGDPRSVEERVRDIRAWDQCVSAAQAVYESDPMRPQLETPEDVCSRDLGMADRDAVPIARRRR